MGEENTHLMDLGLGLNMGKYPQNCIGMDMDMNTIVPTHTFTLYTLYIYMIIYIYS